MFSDTLADYEAFMRAHRMKYRTGFMRSASSAPPHSLKRIVKLQLGKIAARFFAWQERRADMLLSELQASGRGLSFVSVLHEKLARRV